MHILILYGLVFVLLVTPVYGKNLGVVGATYPIAERDALEEVEEKVKGVNWSEYFSRQRIERAVKRYKPDIKHLPEAKENRTFTVDMTYTLDFDISDGKGGILYPKGYTFSPLDYVLLPNTIVIINPLNKKQLEWFREEYNKNVRVTLLITDGSPMELMEVFKRPVYFANNLILEKFKVNALPAVISQKGRFIEVSQVSIVEGQGK